MDGSGYMIYIDIWYMLLLNHGTILKPLPWGSRRSPRGHRRETGRNRCIRWSLQPKSHPASPADQAQKCWNRAMSILTGPLDHSSHLAKWQRDILILVGYGASTNNSPSLSLFPSLDFCRYQVVSMNKTTCLLLFIFLYTNDISVIKCINSLYMPMPYM